MLLVTLMLAVTTPAAPAPHAPPVPHVPHVRRSLWGALGHRLVARLALLELSRPAQREIRRLLGDETLADASVWADQIRRERPETGPLHYVNLPRDATTYDAARDCREERCVVAAIPRYLAILADTAQPKAERVEALRFVVHFVGDLHQPLHAGYGDDKGGNDVKLTYLGRETNLHAVWDSGLLDAAGLGENRYLDRLRRLAKRREFRRAAGGDPVQWANESAALVRQLVYEGTAAGTLDEAYFARVTDTVDRQLALGGLRLARLLEGALGRR